MFTLRKGGPTLAMRSRVTPRGGTIKNVQKQVDSHKVAATPKLQMSNILYAAECSVTNTSGLTSHSLEAVWWNPTTSNADGVARPNAAITKFAGSDAWFYFNAYEGAQFNISSSAFFWTSGVVGSAKMRGQGTFDFQSCYGDNYSYLYQQTLPDGTTKQCFSQFKCT